MSGVKEIYNSIIFLEKWQKLISNITTVAVEKLNDFAKNNNNTHSFSIGSLYPATGIKYGNYINCHTTHHTYTEFLYFGFNFNLYNLDNIKQYPKFNIIGDKLNSIHDVLESYPKELEHFIKAKQEEMIDEYIFGLALNKIGLEESIIDELDKVSLCDIDDFYYIPIETHLLYLDENVEQISDQIINICKRYLF